MPHLAPGTADELLAQAAGKTKDQIRILLAELFARPDVPTLVQAVDPPGAGDTVAGRPADAAAPSLGLDPVGSSLSANLPPPMERLAPRPRVAPLSPGRFALHIPAAVKRAVSERDGGQCTFVSHRGRRCESRTRLELDHIEPVARGGESTVGNLRLRCRVHNEYEAECTFGAEFMRGKREEALEQGRETAARAKGEAQASANAKAMATPKAEAKASAEAEAEAQAVAEAASQKEVLPWLGALGCNAETAKRAAERCAGMVGAPLERRVLVACQVLAPRSARKAVPVASSIA